mmetsp:Transcript_9717/g.16119  ORF Transcript_9717/g.16119 Transcript_9717/m.16119 type:complete len:207 (-) Transcript_9717:108-728(-)
MLAIPPPPIASESIWFPPPGPRFMPTPCEGAPGFSLWGLRTVSSIPKMQQAASVAEAIEFNLLADGSHTPDKRVSHVLSFITSTPIHFPEPFTPVACSFRSLFMTSVLSIPALSASCRGITSNALAKADITSCCLPRIVMECSRRTFDSSSSMAPPPATTERLAMQRFTIMIASWTDRSVSSRNCSPPPRSKMVAVLARGQPEKKL